VREANPKADEWAERIAAQQRGGISVKQFCKEQGVSEYSFYTWRKRLQEKGPVLQNYGSSKGILDRVRDAIDYSRLQPRTVSATSVRTGVSLRRS
jgi:transposase